MLFLVISLMFATRVVSDGISYKTLCEKGNLRQWQFSLDITIPTCRFPNGDDRFEVDEMLDEDIDDLLDLYPGLFKKKETLDIPATTDYPTTTGFPTTTDLTDSRRGLLAPSCHCAVFEEFVAPDFIGGEQILHFRERGEFQFIKERKCRSPWSSCAGGGTCVQETLTQYLAVPGTGSSPVRFEPFDINSGCVCQKIG